MFTKVRRSLLILAGCCVCLYAIAVLSYVLSLPDIGLRCAFTTVLSHVYDHYQCTTPTRVDAKPLEDPPTDRTIVGQINPTPKPGDTLLQVGGNTVRTWPKLLRALIDLPKSPEVVRDLGEAESRQMDYVQVDGERLVRVVYQRDKAGMAPEQYAGWRRISHFPAEEVVPSILWFSLKIGLFVVGALVFWKRPKDRAAAQFFLLCIVTVGAYMGGYHWARIATQPVLLLVFMVCSVLVPVVSLHFYMVFPRPKVFFVRHPWATLAAVYGPALAFLVIIIVGYVRIRWLVRSGSVDEDVNSAWQALRNLIAVYVIVAALTYLFSVASLLHSYGAARDTTERNQVKWILFGSLAALVPIAYTLYLIFWEREAFGTGEATWPMFAASVCLTVAYAVSITRYRLLELDQIISSGAVYLLVSIFAALLYYAVVFAAMGGANMVGSKIVPATSLAQALWVSTTALILMLLLNVIRSRFKKVLDRRFYREKHQLDHTLKRMSEAIEQLVDPPALARRLLQASAELLHVSVGAIYLRDGDPPLYRLAERLGAGATPLTELSLGCPLVEALQRRKIVRTRPGDSGDAAQRQLRFLGGEVAYALAHEDKLLAFLVLGPKAVGGYGPEDLNLLSAFCRLTALALESAQGHHTIEALNGDLRAKVEKISEQQRRILALQNQLTKGLLGPAQPAASRDHAAKAATASMLTAAPSPQQGRDPFGTIVGSSIVLRHVLDMSRKVAPTSSAVLIRGESGTGKELLARALHDGSPRAGKPYVKVHCAALSPGLLESELFGHVKGAFTGAHRDKVGRFEVADGGTLFLDEIGDISLEIQTKLLRAIQEKMFERVGSSEPVKVDVRVVAATHRNLEDLLRSGQFREDLYYRLKVIDLTMPPLRDRREDIPELALRFVQVYCQQSGRSAMLVDDDALAILKAYDWPGNVRQLENVIERAMVVAEGPAITVQELPSELLALDEDPAWVDHTDTDRPTVSKSGNGLQMEREERSRRDRERLVRALANADGNKAKAARALGLARSTLVSRLKKYGLS
jgi:transcriptional regulator with GAF, ATPase, and Fis domain